MSFWSLDPHKWHGYKDKQEGDSVCNRELAQSRQASWRRQHLKALQEHMQGSPIPQPCLAHSWHSINRVPRRALERSSARPASRQLETPPVRPGHWNAIIPSERTFLSAHCIPGRWAWVSGSLLPGWVEPTPPSSGPVSPSPRVCMLPVNLSCLNI